MVRVSFFIAWRRMSQSNQQKLKRDIHWRLANEDYTCRLPKDPKPRVRYKLTLMWYRGHDDNGKMRLVYA